MRMPVRNAADSAFSSLLPLADCRIFSEYRYSARVWQQCVMTEGVSPDARKRGSDVWRYRRNAPGDERLSGNHGGDTGGHRGAVAGLSHLVGAHAQPAYDHSTAATADHSGDYTRTSRPTGTSWTARTARSARNSGYHDDLTTFGYHTDNADDTGTNNADDATEWNVRLTRKRGF